MYLVLKHIYIMHSLILIINSSTNRKVYVFHFNNTIFRESLTQIHTIHLIYKSY